MSRVQSATSVVKRAGINRSFTGAAGGAGRGSFSRPGSSPDLPNKPESEANGMPQPRTSPFLVMLPPEHYRQVAMHLTKSVRAQAARRAAPT